MGKITFKEAAFWFEWFSEWKEGNESLSQYFSFMPSNLFFYCNLN